MSFNCLSGLDSRKPGAAHHRANIRVLRKLQVQVKKDRKKKTKPQTKTRAATWELSPSHESDFMCPSTGESTPTVCGPAENCSAMEMSHS